MATTKTTSKVGDSDEGCDITVVNNSGYQMTLSSSSADHGYFTQGPPTDISKGETTVVKAHGTSGTWTGCQIAFTYVIGDSSGGTSVSWAYEKPYDGTNSYSVTASGAMASNYTIKTSPPYSPSTDDWLSTTTSITKN
jgi:hypothetical protein